MHLSIVCGLKSVAIAAAVLALTACASRSDQAAEANWMQNPTVFTEAAPTASQDKGVATVIFARSSKTAAQPGNVYIDGRYLTSLLPGGYSQQLVCSGSVKVAARLADAQTGHSTAERDLTAINFKPGKTYYIELIDVAGQTDLQFAPLDPARIAEFKLQSHALPRTKTCV